ncbi:MAG: hypothetical protein JXA73_13930 [Acidobacteria bacterium]|nr:hypothetical protein [Acidobacteriota bacterium]
MVDLLQPRFFLEYMNPDGGLPYSPGMPSFSEPTLLTILGLTAAGASDDARPLVEWVLKTRNPDGSIGLNREFPKEGIWNSSLLAIAMHHLGLNSERDAAIDFLLDLRSLKLQRTPDNDLDTTLVGWPWVAYTFGWVEPTAWALLALALAGKSDHPRAVEGRRLLEDRCLPGGGWNYGNKIVFDHTLMPFWDSTAIATLSLGGHNRDSANKNLDLLEKSLHEMESLLTNALTCLCLERFGRKTEPVRVRIAGILKKLRPEELNLAHWAMSLMALSGKRVLTP